MHMTIQKQQLGCEQKIVAIILISRGARTDWSMQPSTLSGIAAKVRAHQSTLLLMTAPPFPTNHQILFAWRSLVSEPDPRSRLGEVSDYRCLHQITCILTTAVS